MWDGYQILLKKWEKPISLTSSQMFCPNSQAPIQGCTHNLIFLHNLILCLESRLFSSLLKIGSGFSAIPCLQLRSSQLCKPIHLFRAKVPLWRPSGTCAPKITELLFSALFRPEPKKPKICGLEEVRVEWLWTQDSDWERGDNSSWWISGAVNRFYALSP